MTTIFIVCGDSLRGNAGQRSMRESNRCDGAQCAHQLFENARLHRVARTRSCSLSCFLCPQFLLVRVFSPKISVVVVVILVIVVGVFDHSDVQTAVVVVFLATVVVVAKLLRFNRY